MMLPVRFIEIATGREVLIETLNAWEPYARISVVSYFDTGDLPPVRFAMPDSEISKYFSVIAPQEVHCVAHGGVMDRPLPKQRELADQPAPPPTSVPDPRAGKAG